MRHLGLWLRDGDRGVAAVAYREPDTAAAARRRLRPANRRVRTYKLVPHASARQTVFELIAAIEAVGDGILHVTGWEEAFGGPDLPERVYDLNFLRESVVDYPATQVWWMPMAFRDAFMIRAPDTWSVMKLKMMLASDDEYIKFSPIVDSVVRLALEIRDDQDISLHKAMTLRQFVAPYSGINDSDLNAITKLKGLYTLRIPGAEVTNLAPLAALHQLRDISLNNIQLSDISALKSLHGVTRLNLYGVPIEDVSPIANLTKLTDLYLTRTQVIDISPLASLTRIETLSLIETNVHSLSPLKGMTNMKTLSASFTRVSKLRYLSNLQNIEYLNLNGTRVHDVSPLQNLLNLRVLRIAGTKISSISQLRYLNNLRFLDLSDTPIKLSSIAAFRKFLPKCRVKFSNIWK